MAAALADIGAEHGSEAPIRIVGSAGLAAEFLPELAVFRRANPDVPIELLGVFEAAERLLEATGYAVDLCPVYGSTGIEL